MGCSFFNKLTSQQWPNARSGYDGKCSSFIDKRHGLISSGFTITRLSFQARIRCRAQMPDRRFVFDRVLNFQCACTVSSICTVRLRLYSNSSLIGKLLEASEVKKGPNSEQSEFSSVCGVWRDEVTIKVRYSQTPRQTSTRNEPT
jgi:hypothetical protein